jgi:hypothetical protein
MSLRLPLLHDCEAVNVAFDAIASPELSRTAGSARSVITTLPEILDHHEIGGR